MAVTWSFRVDVQWAYRWPLWSSRSQGFVTQGPAFFSSVHSCLLACWPSLQFLTEVVSDSLRRATCFSLLALGKCARERSLQACTEWSSLPQWLKRRGSKLTSPFSKWREEGETQLPTRENDCSTGNLVQERQLDSQGGSELAFYLSVLFSGSGI